MTAKLHNKTVNELNTNYFTTTPTLVYIQHSNSKKVHFKNCSPTTDTYVCLSYNNVWSSLCAVVRDTLCRHTSITLLK